MTFNMIFPPDHSSKKSKIKRKTTMSVVLLTSIFLNCVFILTLPIYRSLPSLNLRIKESRPPTSIAELRYDKKVRYTHHTPYWSSNATNADAMWEALSTDSIVVALSDVWTSARGIPRSGRFPWDQSYGRYYIRGMHELHCLKYIRRYVTDWQRSKPELLDGKHVLHCLDSLRQSVMCRADDTLMTTSDDTVFALGDGDEVMCRDWGALISWSQEPERNGCHSTIDEYGKIHHSIERYAFCPANSPFKAVAEAYFAENGHVNPWS